MADVSARRGQLILVAGLGIAVTFVALALILNTAIYAENLGARGGDVGARDVAGYDRAAETTVVALLERVNDDGHDGYDPLVENATDNVSDWDELSRDHYAIDGRAVSTSLSETENGTRIGQDDSTRNFTDADATANWTLAGEVSNARRFRMNVSNGDLIDVSDPLGTDSFRANVTDGEDVWRIYVYRDGGQVEVRTQKNANALSDPCTDGGDYVTIDVTAGTVAGEPCEPLNFAEGLSEPYAISYNHSDNAVGTYELFVDEEYSSVIDGQYDGDGSPYAAHAIYAANVTVTYESAQLTYRSEHRIAPGESDD